MKDYGKSAVAMTNSSRLGDVIMELKQHVKPHLPLGQFHADASQWLSQHSDFLAKFEHGGPSPCFVLSVDLRRSTELMLKSRTPSHFANFIRDLIWNLQDAVLTNFGVFDKFTGDGILSFFPNFYSGPDAGYFAVEAAFLCHRIFNNQYARHRHFFDTVLKDVGLGIGIDFGDVHITQFDNRYTVVGAPVVYACRFNSAPAGSTYLNQHAFEEISAKYSAYVEIEETEIDIKHEGKLIAYSVRGNGATYPYRLPEWAAKSDRRIVQTQCISPASSGGMDNTGRPDGTN